MHILIVEDDALIASFLVKGFSAEGYGSTVAASITAASDLLVSDLWPDPDVVLLDLGLPDGSGEEFLGVLRRKLPQLPVIILTARGQVDDKVRGLDLGANDYVTKPFAFAELLARVRAVARASSQASNHELVVDDLRLDLLTKLAWRAGRRIDLAPREWAMLEMFMRNPTHVLSRSKILSQVWDFSFDPGSNVVDVYVGYLRRKLNRDSLKPLIVTVRGAGYRLMDP